MRANGERVGEHWIATVKWAKMNKKTYGIMYTSRALKLSSLKSQFKSHNYSVIFVFSSPSHSSPHIHNLNAIVSQLRSMPFYCVFGASIQCASMLYYLSWYAKSIQMKNQLKFRFYLFVSVFPFNRIHSNLHFSNGFNWLVILFAFWIYNALLPMQCVAY